MCHLLIGEVMGIVTVNGYRQCLLHGLFLLLAALPAQAQIQRISVDAGGVQSDRDSYAAVISDDGNVVAFQSNATNLIPDDTNNSGDIFVSDLDSGTVERVSLDEDGAEMSNGRWNNNLRPSISADGNRIAFQSYGLQNFAYVLVRDRAASTTTIVLPISFTTNNADRESRQNPGLSGDGRFVAFHCLINFQASEPVSARPADDDLNRVHDIYVYDLDTQPVPPTERISRDADGMEGRGDSYEASLSADGRLVVFYSHADNLVPNDQNGRRDVFVKDRLTGAVDRVSVSSAGSGGNDESQQASLSGDGRYVVFRSKASNLVADDDNDHWDIFVRDRNSGSTERVNVADDGSEANHDSFSPAISDDGRYVVFRSNASNLVADDDNRRFDIFVHDRDSARTVKVSAAADGSAADNHSYQPDISADGNWIVFESDATNLVAGDTNQSRDIFRVANPLAGL